MGAIREYVDAITTANSFVHAVDRGHDALAGLVAVRQQVVDGLATIQAGPYTALQKSDALAEAVALRDAIRTFANSL